MVQAFVVQGSVYGVEGLKKANWRCSRSHCRRGAAGFTDSGQQAASMSLSKRALDVWPSIRFAVGAQEVFRQGSGTAGYST